MTTDPRITKGCELLAAYEAAVDAAVDATGADVERLAQYAENARHALTNWFVMHIDFFLRTLPARVAELEEGLRPFAGLFEVWRAAHDAEAESCPYRYSSSADLRASNSEAAEAGDEAVAETIMRDWIIRAASLLSDSKAGESAPTPTEASDDQVERVAKDAAERAAKNSGSPPQMLYAPILFALRDGLSALRMPAPAVDEGKLREDSDG